jgi:hypothetical protein
MRHCEAVKAEGPFWTLMVYVSGPSDMGAPWGGAASMGRELVQALGEGHQLNEELTIIGQILVERERTAWEW